MANEVPEPERWVADNYRGLIEDGHTPEELAAIAEERNDPHLAAWLRSQSAPSRSAAPKSRNANGGKVNG